MSVAQVLKGALHLPSVGEMNRQFDKHHAWLTILQSVRWWPRILFKGKIGSVGATTLLERGSIKILGTGLLGGAFG